MTNAVDVQQWRDQLRHVLNTVWDPIGECPPDEYDRYRDDIEAMVRHGENDETFERYLVWAVTVHMGMGMVFDAAALREGSTRTIAAIRALGPAP